MRSRHGPFRRAGLLGVFVAGLVLALSAPGIALAAADLGIAISYTAGDPVAIPVQGPNRYLTAVEASKKFGSAATVVVATGEAFPDALGGAALAGAVDGPLLLTRAASVPAEVLAEIHRLGATKMYVLGGTAAVSAAAFSQLDAAITGTPVRLGGPDRYDTGLLVANETIRLLGGSYGGGAMMATGVNFPDALASSPIMFKKGMPLVLVDPAGEFTLSASMTKVTILGGTNAVPASVQTALGSKYDGRLAGPNRYATAAAVADYGVSQGMTWNNVGIATGQNFPDALCAGPLVGSKNAVLLLTTTATLSTDAASALGAHKAAIDQYYLFGGVLALSDNVRAQIAEILAGTPNSHALPASVSCSWSGCHDTDLATIHIAKGCYMCHGAGATPSSDCVSCHGAMPHDVIAAHAAITSVPATATESCTQASCHGTVGALALHTGGCAECHASSRAGVQDAIMAGNATCESCHDYATVHVIPAGSHTVSGDCFTSTCHGTDVANMHTIDFRGTGDTPPGCAACHGAGKTPSKDCMSCHENLASKHVASVAHATVQAGMAGEGSSACVACHGANLMAVAPGEHVGCSCHAHAIVRGAAECADCHEGAHAAHGFAEGDISGHSTPTYGVKGMFEYFDGTGAAGHSAVALKDSNGDTVTAEWAIPNDRVFWDKSEINLGGFKPANAFLGDGGMGLTASSVIGCEDCHTGLEAFGAGDPQGANLANAGLDPNYEVPFNMGVLSGYWDTRQRVGDELYAQHQTRSGISYRTAVTGPDDGIVDGTNDVICAKCHDLYQEIQIDSNVASATVHGDESLRPAAGEEGYGQLAHADHVRGKDVGGSTGRGDCVNCHIAVPHGWKRPRLLVQSIDATIVLTNEDGVTTRTVGIAPDPYPYNQVRGFWNSVSWETTPGPLAGQGFFTDTAQKTGFGVLPGRDASGAQVQHEMVSQDVTLTVGGVATGGFTFEYPEWESNQCSASCGGTHHRIYSTTGPTYPRSIIE